MKKIAFALMFGAMFGGIASPAICSDPDLELVVQFKQSIMPQLEGTLNSVSISPPELGILLAENGVIYIRKIFLNKPEYRIVNGFSVKMPNYKNYYVLEVGAAASLEGLIASLAVGSETSGFEKNAMVIEAQSSCSEPNDTGVNGDPVYQWYLVNDGSFVGHINIEPAWSMVCGMSGADGPIIGLMDTGARDIAGELDVTAFGGMGIGHGTQVLGVISATPNNNFGMSGVARNVDKNLSWRMGAGSTFEDFIAYVDSAIAAGVTLVSSSTRLGGWKFSRLALKGVQELYLSGIPFIVASGQGSNSDAQLGLPYPARFGLETIGVSGTKKNGLWGTEQYGTILFQGVGQDICAPVDDVVVFETTWDGTVGYREGGTSFAQPLVAGTIALMKIVNGALIAEDYEGVLASTAVNLAGDGYDTKTGWGRLDAGRAVTNLAGNYELNHHYLEGYASVDSTDVLNVYFSGFDSLGIAEYASYNARQYKIWNTVSWSGAYLDSVFCWGMHLGDGVNGLKEATLYSSDDGDATVIANVLMSYADHDGITVNGASFYTYAYSVYADGDTVDIGPTNFSSCKMNIGVIGKVREPAEILTPNGGETFHTGYPTVISWETVDVIGRPGSNFDSVDIIFMPSGAAEDTIIAGLDASLASYSWAPAFEQFSSDGKIRVEYYNATTPEERGQDESDSGFEIIQSLEPWVSDRAVFSLFKDADPNPVFAIEVISTSSDSTIAEAYVDASLIGGGSHVDLNDSGLLGDQFPNDNIWSAYLSVLTIGGLYDLPVMVRDDGWNAISKTVEVEVVEALAVKFANKSSSTDQLQDVGGQPYAAATINFQHAVGDSTDWNDEDLIVSLLDAPVTVFAVTGRSPEDVPGFTKQSGAFSTPSIPGNRGITVADFDNDSYEDFYVARNTSPNLYRWNPNLGTSGQFEDVADSVFGHYVDSTFYNLNWGKAAAASWADYDQDGWVDLVVGRDSFNWPRSPSEPDTLTMPTSGAWGESIVRYHNEQGRLVLDVTDYLGSFIVNSFSVNWCDVDLDGDQDLFVADYFDQGKSKIFVNNGFDSGYSFTEQTVPWFVDTPSSIVGAEFVDIDSDGDPDLVTVSETAADNLSIFVNSGGSPAPEFNLVSKQTSRLPEVSVPLNGILTGDFDLNGFVDIATLPNRLSGSPRMLFNGLGEGPGVFSRSVAFDSIQSGPLYGAVANDWNTDGDVDLYLGRGVNIETGNADDFFYQALDKSDVDQIIGVRYLKVRLVGNRAETNMSAIGAKVEVLVAAQRIGPTQWVSGGDGRGGQRPRTLVFGFPANNQPSGTVDVRVIWPDGKEEIFWGVALDTPTPVKLADTRVARIEPNTVLAHKNLNATTGDIDWVFEWDSNRPLSNAGVRFNPNPTLYGNPPACFCEGVGQVIVVNGANATVTEVQTGPWTYHYTVDWPGWCCDTDCTYEFEVFGTFDSQEVSNDPMPTGPRVCMNKFPGM